MGLAEATADIKVVRDQLLKSIPDLKKAEPWQRELLDNILPLIEGLAGGVKAEFDDLDETVESIGDAVDELIDGNGEVILPETAQKIAGVFAAGALIADELERVLGKLDDVAKRKCRDLIKMYRQGVELVSVELAEMTMDEEAQPQVADGEPADPDAAKETP